MQQPPLRKRTRRRWPWERDPNDREANYRRPVPTRERVRLAVKGASVVAAFLWVRVATQDGRDEGAEVLAAVGAVLAVVGAIDLAWTSKGWLEHIFIEKRPLQLVYHAATAIVGAVLLGAALARLT